MRPRAARLSAVLVVMALPNGHLLAQALGSGAPSCSSGSGNSLLRTGLGATLGAWLGFVGTKIKQSDWNDASRSAAAHRTRVRATIGGAVIGAALGSIRFRSASCAPRLEDARTAPQADIRRPITAEEIQQSGINGSVYDLVYSLRRSWLNLRGVETFNEAPRAVEVGGQEFILPGEPRLVVYLDNARMGTVSQLRQLPVVGVTAVRYFDGPQATFRWGAGHSHGAIQVITVSDSTQ